MEKILFVMMLANFILAKELILGVVPQQSPKKLYEAWQPFADYLSKETGIKVVFKTERSIPVFEKKLYSGEYDIAYSNPYHFVIAQKLQNHEAVARFDKKIVGILVAKNNSSINSIDDVKNKEILFPAPKAFAATILTKYEILEKASYNVDKSQNYRYVNSHDSVYLGVIRGIGEVGGGIERTFNNFKEKNKLKVIYKTDSYPSHPISVSNSISKEDKQKIQNALLKMPKEIISKINKKPLTKTVSSEYDSVKKLAIDLEIY